MIDCCLSENAVKEVELTNNLFHSNKLSCNNKLLFLYSFLEKQGININKYDNIVKNINQICGKSCNDDVSTISVDFYLEVEIVCSDSIIAESFVIYW